MRSRPAILSITLLGLKMISTTLPGFGANEPDWVQVQEIKHESLVMAARNAMDQQKRAAADPISIDFPGALDVAGEMRAWRTSDGELGIIVSASPVEFSERGQESVRIPLPETLNMYEHHSGLAMTVEVEHVHPEVRWGVRLIGSNGRTADILPRIPILSHWGNNRHEIYLDWAFINYAEIEDAIAVLESVTALEFTAASARRAPDPGRSSAPREARFTVSDLQLVDYLKGSYDPNRHRWGWDGGDGRDFTLQHRVQEISGVVARFGGREGVESAIEALDLAVRTQCWDGSFLDRRRGANTVVSGEYTHGFTLWGIMDAYEYFEEINLPELDQELTIGPDRMTRRDFYQRMLYRGGMSRATPTPSEYRDDIIRGNVLVTGANRVLGYAMAMPRIADLLENPRQRDEILSAYLPVMQEIANAQGAFSGGFPLLAEGNRFDGRGIHYDAGYIRTHMTSLAMGIQVTGDPLLVSILDRYQEVIQAVMNEEGTGILRLLSERGPRGGPVGLVIPDVFAQVGLEYNLPVVAQWGYNVGMRGWAAWKPGARLNHFTAARTARGYSLGAHMNVLLADLNYEPIPRDIGYRFPRQYPVWSSRFYRKDDGAHTRTSRVSISPDGSRDNDFRIEVGEFLATVGVPVWIEKTAAAITAEAVALDGWPSLLADDDPLLFTGGPGEITGKVNSPVQLQLAPGQNRIEILGPLVTLPDVAGGASIPFRIEIILSHLEKTEVAVTLSVRNQVP